MINPSNGEVEFCRVYDTYRSAESFETMISNITIPDGFIIAAACKDDCATNLSHRCRMWFGHMGSLEIWNVGYRQGFVFIGRSGGKADFVENKTVANADSVTLTKMFMLESEYVVPVKEKTNPKAPSSFDATPKPEDEEKRKKDGEAGKGFEK